MDIPTSQIEFKRKVGRSGGSELWHIKTYGGLHTIFKTMGKSMRFIGSGPHRAVAQRVAEKFDPEIVWTELSKSDHIDEAVIAPLVAEYYKITLQARKLQQEK